MQHIFPLPPAALVKHEMHLLFFYTPARNRYQQTVSEKIISRKIHEIKIGRWKRFSGRGGRIRYNHSPFLFSFSAMLAA